MPLELCTLFYFAFKIIKIIQHVPLIFVKPFKLPLPWIFVYLFDENVDVANHERFFFLNDNVMIRSELLLLLVSYQFSTVLNVVMLYFSSTFTWWSFHKNYFHSHFEKKWRHKFICLNLKLDNLNFIPYDKV